MEFISSIDNAFINFILNIQNDFLTGFFKVFTFLGDKGILWIAIGLILLIPKKTQKIGIVYIASLAFSTLFSELVFKHIVCRERPFISDSSIKLLIPAVSGYSFPSSHSASSFCCATALYLQNKKWGRCAYVISSFIAISRMYFTVHYFTDVVVGCLWGVISAIIIYAVFKKIENRTKA